MKLKLARVAGWLLVSGGAAACSQPAVVPEPTQPEPTARYAPLSPAPTPLACDEGDTPEVELDCADVLHSRLTWPRVGARVAALTHGTIVVVGGSERDDPDATPVPSAEIYDPQTRAWTAIELPDTVDASAYGSARLHAGDGTVWLVDHGPSIHRLDLESRTWLPVDSPFEVTAPLATVAGVLSDGALLVVAGVTPQRAALYVDGTWTHLAEVTPASETLDWIAPLRDGGALLDGTRHYDRPGDAWTELEAPRRVERGNYVVAPLPDGRVAALAGCSDGGECWGDSEVDVFDPQTLGWQTTPELLGREHSVAPVGAVLSPDAGGAARVMLTSDFGEGREIELCRVGPVADAMPACRCGGCEVAPRSAVTAVRDPSRADCMLLVGGALDLSGHPDDESALDEVLRLCWSDDPLVRIDTHGP